MIDSTYNLWSLVIQVVTLVVLVSALAVYFFQLRAMSGQLGTAQAALRRMTIPILVQHLESPPVREARRVVRTELRKKPFAKWTKKEQAAAAEILAAYGIAGAFARNKEVDKKVILDHWGHSIVGVCEICREFIADRRGREGKGYMRSLLWLEAKAKKALMSECC